MNRAVASLGAMPGPPPPGTPPEVPEEFAEAYRAAYEAALEAQSVPVKRGEHAARVDDQELPQRTRAIRIGTHRASRPFETVAGATSSGTRSSGSLRKDEVLFRRARVTDSPWFVPLLLIALALLLVIGAYVVGRAFAQHVADDKVESQHLIARFTAFWPTSVGEA